jgi:hypothetical protein
LARNDFALGALLGGLAGIGLGYLISRSGTAADEVPPASTIDLTPALERRNAETAAADAAPAPTRRRRVEPE